MRLEHDTGRCHEKKESRREVDNLYMHLLTTVIVVSGSISSGTNQQVESNISVG